MADVARNPAFAAEEVERQRQQTLDGLQVSLRQPGQIARYALTRAMFGLGPYGGVASPKSIGAIKAADLAAYHGRHYRPDSALLVISGDISAEDGVKLAEKYFGDWPKPAAPAGTEAKADLGLQPPRAIVVDLPKSGQAAVSFGMLGVPRTADDYFPAMVANSVLGGGYSARLNQEIRIKRGLSYGVGSGFPARQSPGPIIAIAQTKNESAVQVVDLMNQEFAKIMNAEVPAPELGARQANLIGSFGRDVETASGLAGQLATLAAFGIPLEKLTTYVADVSAVTPASAKEAAVKLYDPKKASLVVVGDGTVFFNALKKKRPDVVRIPIDKLNLDSATLQ
jgi:zinc protease